THASTDNSRFLLASEFCAQYFERYCLPSARTAWVSAVGPNWRSRVAVLSRQDFLTRDINCLIALNLTRVGGTLAGPRDPLRSLPSDLGEAVDEAIAHARLALAGPLEIHLAAALARRGKNLPDAEFNSCFQIVEDATQIWRRQKIFEVAARFP